MQTNFHFLQKEFSDIYKEIVEAEKHTFTAPRYAALLCRSTLEKAFFWLYQNDEDLELPYDTKLGALLHNDSFKAILKPSMLMELDIVRLYGNNAAHGKNIKALEALQALKNSFRFLSWLSKYYSQENPEIADFDERHIPYGDVADKTKKELQALTEKFDKEREQANKLAKKQAVLAEENEKLKQQLEPIEASCCNSAAIYNYPELHFDYVRPGIMLYGSSPFADISAKTLGLQPVMRFKSRVMAIQELSANESVGYGSTYITTRPTRLGIVAVGYGDGYPRALTAGAFVSINGQAAPVLGRVSMDLMAVDLTDLAETIQIGQLVELWGNYPEVDQLAQYNQTIGYELLCRLSARPERRIID